MPLYILRKVWKYCSYNIPFFAFIVILIFILSWIPNYSYRGYGSKIGFIVQFIISVILTGYGLSITRDRINHGYRLPKIMPKDVFYFGIKGTVVYAGYLAFQAFVLTLISSQFDFPLFNMEEWLLDFNGTFNLLISHNPIHSIVFLIIAAAVFYVTSFFAEIGLAKLADTGRITSAFNLVDIFRNIDLFGWRNYARDMTSIIMAIVIMTYVKSILPPFFWFDKIIGMILGLMIFATQYLGIGSVYCEIKDMKRKNVPVNN